MSKRVKVIVSIAVAMLLLTIGIAVPVIAQEDSTPPASETKAHGLLDRVAEILGDVSQEELINAFKEARQELREEAFWGTIDKALEKGLIDEDEASAIKDWWQKRPEALNRVSLLPFGKTECPIHPRCPGIRPWSGSIIAKAAEILGIPQEDLVNAFKQAIQEIRNEFSSRALNNTTEKERITRMQANKIRELWAQRQEEPKRLLAPAFRAMHQARVPGLQRGWLKSRPLEPAP